MCSVFQLLRGMFEGFLKKLQVGEERLQSCSDVAGGLIRSKHPQSPAVRDTLQQLRLELHTLLNLCGRSTCPSFSVCCLQCMLGGPNEHGPRASGSAAESRGMFPLPPGPERLPDAHPGIPSFSPGSFWPVLLPDAAP